MKSHIPLEYLHETLASKRFGADNKDSLSVSVEVQAKYYKVVKVQLCQCDCSEAALDNYGDWDIEKFITIDEPLQIDKLMSKFSAREAQSLLKRIVDRFRQYGTTSFNKFKQFLEKKYTKILLYNNLVMRKRIVFFTGAGVSKESGLMTFRGEGGIWGQFDPDEVADVSVWRCGRRKDRDERRQKALDFFNPLRRMLLEHHPNEAHQLIASLEPEYDVTVITQNGDDYHTRAGSSNVIYLHGEALKNCSCANPYKGWACDRANPDIKIGDKAPDGSQIRPYIIYFNEDVDKRLWNNAVRACREADVFVIVGSTMLVHPACDLVAELPRNCKIYIIDPQPISIEKRNVTHYQCGATEGMKRLIKDLEL